jgi:hypothetical protein
MSGGKIVPLIAGSHNTLQRELQGKIDDVDADVVKALDLILDRLDRLREDVDELKQRRGLPSP